MSHFYKLKAIINNRMSFEKIKEKMLSMAKYIDNGLRLNVSDEIVFTILKLYFCKIKKESNAQINNEIDRLIKIAQSPSIKSKLIRMKIYLNKI